MTRIQYLREQEIRGGTFDLTALSHSNEYGGLPVDTALSKTILRA
jgi:hypothetical protein